MQKNVFITSCGGLGDLIVCTPALKRLKEKYDYHITFLCQDKYKDILIGLPYIDKVVTIKRGTFMGRYKCIFKGRLYKQDAVVFTDWHPILLWFSHIFRVPLIAGETREGHKLSKYLTRPIKNQVFVNTHYSALSNAMTYSMALDIDLDGEMTDIEVAEPTPADCRAVTSLLQTVDCKEYEYILLSPFATLKERNWPVERARDFVETIEQKYGIPVIVMGAPADRESAARITKRNLVGKTSILQLVQLIKQSMAIVSVDSGPMHIAGAVGTSCVALFSKDLPSRWAPRKNCQPIYLQYECSPCSDETARACPNDVKCMKDISAAMVEEKLCELLKL